MATSERTAPLIINEGEAKTVRVIFDLFLRLQNVRKVQNELARLDLRTKPYAVKRGRATRARLIRFAPSNAGHFSQAQFG